MLICVEHRDELALVGSAMVWEQRPSQWQLTYVLKGTFTLEEAPRPAPQQDGSHADVLFEQTERASLYAPTDFAPRKPRADVLLVGSAFAPGGAPVEALTARLTAGEISKALRIVGERERTSQGPSRPRPFARMPLRYERAVYRGENLVGGADRDASRPLPCIDVEGPGETPGFAPIAPAWRAFQRALSPESRAWIQRLRGVSAHDVHARSLVVPPSSGAPPAGFDFGYFNAAPRDQQAARLAPGMPVLLENLLARRARLALRLPAIAPVAFHVDPTTAAVTELPMVCDTLWIDTDREVLVLSWRGSLAISPPGEAGVGRIVHRAVGPGERVTYEDLAPRAKASKPPAHLAGTAPISPALRAALPFMAQRKAPAKVATTAMPAFDVAPRESAPFPLAAPSVAPAQPAPAALEIVGAPWASGPTPVVMRPGRHLASTMSAQSMPSMQALAALTSIPEPVPLPALAPPPAVAEPPAALAIAPAPPPSRSPPPPRDTPGEPPRPKAAPLVAVAYSGPAPSPWRDDPPAQPLAPVAAAPADPPRPAVKGGVYGDFARHRRR